MHELEKLITKSVLLSPDSEVKQAAKGVRRHFPAEQDWQRSDKAASHWQGQKRKGLLKFDTLLINWGDLLLIFRISGLLLVIIQYN